MERCDRAAEPGLPWTPGSYRPAAAAQAMDSPYANGAYTPPYPPASHYTGLAQTRGYHCSGPPYPSEPSGRYRCPSPAPPWSYTAPEGPNEGSSLRRQQQGPSYSPPQTPGMPIPQYPYGDSSSGVTPPPQPRGPEDAWAPHPVYGVQPRYPWASASVHGNPFVADSHPSWTSSGASSHPTAWDSKDVAYDKPEYGTDHHSFYPDGHHQHYGTGNEPTAAPLHPKVQYSAQPQLYDNVPRKPWAGNRELRAGEHQPAVHSTGIQPGIQRILHVMGEAEQLEEEVDEFVGKKTDKSYRLLEEMLTKLLLELDSVETGGQGSVRQARKESVHRIQAILDKLERKGL
ncbi:BAG family molecular chaperone regulator 4 [Melopsittacus undulatus]|uniref:BAG family molecular chaperone regulator 4 n=1 Tax=Melopsittacus undulatus TaxID=13146 RepID=UPI00146B8747|nr:BAG family molecular chaperone regulator 4 [Melopsittacus undulatus]